MWPRDDAGAALLVVSAQLSRGPRQLREDAETLRLTAKMVSWALAFGVSAWLAG